MHFLAMIVRYDNRHKARHLPAVIAPGKHVMKFTFPENSTPTPGFRASKGIAMEDLPHNQDQSHQIHEPAHKHNGHHLIIGRAEMKK